MSTPDDPKRPLRDELRVLVVDAKRRRVERDRDDAGDDEASSRAMRERARALIDAELLPRLFAGVDGMLRSCAKRGDEEARIRLQFPRFANADQCDRVPPISLVGSATGLCDTNEHFFDNLVYEKDAQGAVVDTFWALTRALHSCPEHVIGAMYNHSGSVLESNRMNLACGDISFSFTWK